MPKALTSSSSTANQCSATPRRRGRSAAPLAFLPTFLVLSLALVTLCPADVRATVFIDCGFDSPPTSESQGGRYSCETGAMTLNFASNLSGRVFRHSANEGWNGSGGAKFYTHETSDNSYRQLFPSSFSTSTQQNQRYLIKLEPGAADELDGKWSLAEPGAGVWRTWHSLTRRGCGLGGYRAPEIAYNNTMFVLHGGGNEVPCDGYQWCANSDTFQDHRLTSCTVNEARIIDFAEHENEWISIEIERTSTGVYKLYIWTEDGDFNGLYYTIDTTFTDSPTTPAIGAYLEGTNTSGKYFIIDEVVYSDEYIGPPAGFGGTPPTAPTAPTAPENLRVDS